MSKQKFEFLFFTKISKSLPSNYDANSIVKSNQVFQPQELIRVDRRAGTESNTFQAKILRVVWNLWKKVIDLLDRSKGRQPSSKRDGTKALIYLGQSTGEDRANLQVNNVKSSTIFNKLLKTDCRLTRKHRTLGTGRPKWCLWSCHTSTTRSGW